VLKCARGAVDASFVRTAVCTICGRTTEALPDEQFLAAVGARRVERLRKAWDPQMAKQIAAHVTVTHPEELPTAEQLMARLAVAVRHVGPFRLRAGDINVFGPPEEGVYVEVADIDGGWRALRDAVGAAQERLSVAPDITLVHPRTSPLGSDAWKSLEGTRIESEAVITAITVSGFDGTRWRVLQTERLGGRSSKARRGRA
jgi:hypothetical protein